MHLLELVEEVAGHLGRHALLQLVQRGVVAQVDERWLRRRW